jgi:transcriptional regulator with XRE-family HTH domain
MSNKNMMDEAERRQALADFLRTRRARLSPADVGLPSVGYRRAKGLRREEVAQLANIGTSWYTSLEQGRDIHPSEQVLESLAQALKLTAAERNHLFLLARSTMTVSAPLSEPEEEAGQLLERLVNNLDPHPAYVLGRRWDILAWNRTAELVYSFSKTPAPYTRNFVWRLFTNPEARDTCPDQKIWEYIAWGIVAQFRADSAHFPGDAYFAGLIEDLKRASELFCKWWTQHDVLNVADCRREINHPVLGRLEFEQATLQYPANPELKVIIHTPSPTTRAKLTDATFASHHP